MDSKKIRLIAALSMLSALAVASTLVIRVPFGFAPPHMRYDPQDVFILIGGFIYGPVAAAAVSAVVALTRFAISATTGHWGLLMNFLATASFAVPAAWVYMRHKTFKGAAAALIAGIMVMIPTMLLLNYLVVPLFAPRVTREDVMAMLIPIILPFNLLKGGINMALVLLMYKPLMAALKKINIIKAE